MVYGPIYDSFDLDFGPIGSLVMNVHGVRKNALSPVLSNASEVGASLVESNLVVSIWSGAGRRGDESGLLVGDWGERLKAGHIILIKAKKVREA